MKEFINKPCKMQFLDDSGKSRDVTYADLIKYCLDTPPQGGFSVSEMSKRIKILDILENSESGANLSFGKDQGNTIMQCIDSSKWSRMHRDITEFVDYARECFQ
jgi:hypothetical protein